jgi:hypothetical protein
LVEVLMAEYPGGEMVKLTFIALRDDVDFAIRLRSLLKFALRCCRLRCRAVEDVPAWKDDRTERSARISDPGAITAETPKERNP